MFVHGQWPSVPFRRVFDRALLGTALLGLWPLLRAVGIRSWNELGYVPSRRWWRQCLAGLLTGVGSFALAGGLLLLLQFRSLDLPEARAHQLVGFALTGVVVAVIEETFFRGGLQNTVQRASNPWLAVVATSAVYSVVHFLKPKGAGVAYADVNWLSGFDYLGQILTRSWRTPGFGVGFVTLWLAGCILGLALVRTRALYFSMGIHAGWIFTLKTYAALTDAVIRRTWWGGAALVDNALVWPFLVVVLWLCWKKLKPLPS
jgi:membrane protease YdiL (CAAX protease family)